uniref:Uncharacterized protein n=1 Tax=Eutreptiella gymnastica TaxID=73025 RepID=A0A7S1IA07_9EUGL
MLTAGAVHGSRFPCTSSMSRNATATLSSGCSCSLHSAPFTHALFVPFLNGCHTICLLVFRGCLTIQQLIEVKHFRAAALPMHNMTLIKKRLFVLINRMASKTVLWQCGAAGAVYQGEVQCKSWSGSGLTIAGTWCKGAWGIDKVVHCAHNKEATQTSKQTHKRSL